MSARWIWRAWFLWPWVRPQGYSTGAGWHSLAVGPVVIAWHRLRIAG